MNTSELIELVLRPHEVSVELDAPGRPTTVMTWTLPDLRTAPRSVTGDWGPWYVIDVPPKTPIQFSVRHASGKESPRRTLDVTKLVVESPMLCETRERTPLFIELPLDEPRGRLRIYYDARGMASRAEVQTGSFGDYGRPCPAEIKRQREVYSNVTDISRGRRSRPKARASRATKWARAAR